VGVATADPRGSLTNSEIAGSGWPSSLLWEPQGDILVEEQNRWVRYRYRASGITNEGTAPLPSPVWNVALSSDGSLLAYEPIQPVNGGYTSALEVFVERTDGSNRRKVAKGSLAGWAPNGQLLVWPHAIPSATQAGSLEAIDVETNHIRPLLFSGHRVAMFADALRAELGAPIFSHDGRWMAAQAALIWPKGKSKGFTAIVIARGSDGAPVRVLESDYHISMLGWSPTSDQLAYTTSGFPFPHQLIVVSAPDAKPDVLFASPEHFDWFTWSPDGRWILIDDEHLGISGAWLVLSIQGGPPTPRPRLGGEPMWCCPAGQFIQAY
jgi:hypothetical protein